MAVLTHRECSRCRRRLYRITWTHGGQTFAALYCGSCDR